jgi:hypothetical protein
MACFTGKMFCLGGGDVFHSTRSEIIFLSDFVYCNDLSVINSGDDSHIYTYDTTLTTRFLHRKTA